MSLFSSFLSPIPQKISWNIQNILVLDDCEYEYEEYAECTMELQTEINSFINALPAETQDALYDILLSYEYLSSQEIGELTADLLGENAFCTDEIIPLLDLALICRVPPCNNCESDQTKLQEDLDAVRDIMLLQIGCTSEYQVCDNSTEIPTFSPTKDETELSELDDLGQVSLLFSVFALVFAIIAIVLVFLSLHENKVEMQRSILEPKIKVSS
eukprot:snap_masked-scaffold_2-processed-gene-26.27-mRNA-1 protein AED:1.00 eAED:1.00 QI:0/-1/0/0/-1/1/1/0/213